MVQSSSTDGIVVCKRIFAILNLSAPVDAGAFRVGTDLAICLGLRLDGRAARWHSEIRSRNKDGIAADNEPGYT